MCKDRLLRARQALQRSHGPHQERVRVLHGNFRPEMATWVQGMLMGACEALPSNTLLSL